MQFLVAKKLDLKVEFTKIPMERAVKQSFFI